MSEKYKAHNPEGTYFITLKVVDWVDLFTRPEYKHLLCDSLNYCTKIKGLIIYGYVFMTNHIHLLVSTNECVLIQDVVRDFKRHTSKELLKLIQESPTESRREWLLAKFAYTSNRVKRNFNYKIWQDGFHPVECDTNKLLSQKLEYIHENPVKEEIVMLAEEYKFSSARDYAGDRSDVYVTLI